MRPLLIALCLVLSCLCASTTLAQCSGGSCSFPTPLRSVVRQAPVRTFVSRGPLRTRLFPRLFAR